MVPRDSSNGRQRYLNVTDSFFHIGSTTNAKIFSAIWVGTREGDWTLTDGANYLGRVHVRLSNVQTYTMSSALDANGFGVFAYGRNARVRISNSQISGYRAGNALITGHRDDVAASHGRFDVSNSIVDSGSYSDTIRSSGVSANSNANCIGSTSLTGQSLSADCLIISD